MVFLIVSCKQKNKETTTDNPHIMGKDSTSLNNKTKLMETGEKMYACPMHPEVKGKMNDKCNKCGMNLTEPVPEKMEESK